MTPLGTLLAGFRSAAVTEREKGGYFEELIVLYLRHEASYRDLYSQVWRYGDWAREQGLDARDTGIDLVAQTRGTGEFHAIQCKLYAPTHRLQKGEIDSFFTASGKKPFTHRLIVCTTNLWSEHAEEALRDQQPPVSKIDLQALEESQIDWSRYQSGAQPELKPKKELRPHQKTALAEVLGGLKSAERGKLIMACGTGKTLTSLKIAEALAGAGGRVLFLVPSLALLSQTLTEWSQESAVPLHSFAVCSDADVGKKRKRDDDVVTTFTHELRYPATTDAAALAHEMGKRHSADHLSVVFGTYHSIDVLHRAQRDFQLPDFDLVVCDEAHRTTGATFESEEESAFVRVHDNAYLRAAKRLYMTATPRIYGDNAKATAQKENVALCSMDDEALYGRELHVICFSEAVKRGLLVDYKVLVLAVDEAHINRRLQVLLQDGNNQLKVDDAAKIIGCWKALSKHGLGVDLADDGAAMRRAVAFCRVIDVATGSKTHKVSSRQIAAMFQAVVEAYQQAEAAANQESGAAAIPDLACEAMHVDGGMNAGQKEEKLAWLKEEAPAGVCRILSNVRCLSEGVDVPALDAVLFLSPRNSQVDVVQSVGRVMRNAPGKTRGYIILPVVIPAGVEPHEALGDNKTYAVVWQVLQALRAHDDRFDALINKLDLIGRDPSRMEVIAVCDQVQRRATGKAGVRSFQLGEAGSTYGETGQTELHFNIGEIERALYAKLVQKCGNRHHWEDWANDIAKIARTHIDRLGAILENPAHVEERAAFAAFAAELRDDLNDSLSDAEILEMLAQHLITQPVFDALFEGYTFTQHNPMSQAMQRVLELYDKFFRNAFPKLTERLGIVYTPVEVVDFILHSVEHLLQTEFGQGLGSPGVHILDPFTGTGTFITRLLQSGLIAPGQLAHKYRHEIHANEIVLLAYYIAAINIEAVYHSLAGGDYVPFEGICLADTFQLGEKADLIDQLLEDNSARRTRQKALDLRVIIGNPPYSIGQKSENDNNDNVSYPHLDERIRGTYAHRSQAKLSKGLYDSYIRAIRWASDRLGDRGVIGFVTNAGWLEANSADGLRRCLAEEFGSLHVFHLRGNQRTQGEQSRKEGGKIFGSGSRAPIAITFLVKNPDKAERGRIHFHDIGDYLSREEKLARIVELGSIAGIEEAGAWRELAPDEHGDWLKQRADGFGEFLPLGNKSGDASTLFENFSMGVVTARDSWCYNASREQVSANINRLVDFYHHELERLAQSLSGLSKSDRDTQVEALINTDASKISWSRALKQDLGKMRGLLFDKLSITQSLYRPFTKQWFYFNRRLNEIVYQMPLIFPDAAAENRVIMVKQRWSGHGHFALMADRIVDLQPDGGAQCFPLYLYDEAAAAPASGAQPADLFSAEAADSAPAGRTRRHAITDTGLAHFQEAYPGAEIGKEDLFYYVYGLLHSPDYRERYADNLSKELPRIPRVPAEADFWAFSRAGRELAELHVGYEQVARYPLQIDSGGRSLSPDDYRVEKMRFGKQGKEKDRTVLVYNERITLRGIPLEAYDYVVNGKPALEWVVERQCVKTDKDSGIVNDANAWAVETMGNPRYPLELVQRVITVSLETQRIVSGLPRLELV